MYFSFERPEYLWYLLAIPLLALTHFILLKYNKRKAIRFANFKALKRVSEQKIMSRNYIILVIRIFILLFIILAIAGTTFWYSGSTSKNDFILAIDTSASMSAQDLTPRRLDVAKNYGREFVDQLDSDSSVGIVSFSGAAFIEQLPTRDKNEIKLAISDLDLTRSGWTDIAGAMVTSSNMLLSSSHRGKAIILITDGSNTAGYFTSDPIGQGIRYVQQNNIVVYTIGLGSNSGPIGYLPEYYNVSSVYDEAVLQRIASNTSGKYFHVQNNAQMKQAYNDILLSSQTAFVDIDLGIGLMILALLLIFLEWGLMNTRFKSLPE